jgi:hypothetical protein
MGLAAKLSLVSDFGERQAERMPVELQAGLRELGAAGKDARIHNLSTHGFMAEADEYYQVGTYVWLKLPVIGGVNARIIWRDCFRYGCEFVTPIDSEQCHAALARGEQTDY